MWALSSHTENFGVAVLEALAAGLPVVISPAVNIAAAIEQAGAGVVAPLEPASFAEALRALLCDPGRRAELSVAARTFARRYDWENVAPSLARLYASVAK